MQARPTKSVLRNLAPLLAACAPGIAGADLGESWSVELGESAGETRVIHSGGRFQSREFRAGAWWRDAIGGHLEGRILDDVAGFGPIAARVDFGIGWRLVSTPSESLDIIAAARWLAREGPDAPLGPEPYEDPSPLAVLRYRSEFAHGLAVEAAVESSDEGSWGLRSGLRLELDSGWELRLEGTIHSDADELVRALGQPAVPADRSAVWIGLSRFF